MTNENRKKYRSSFTAQASAAITAANFSGGSQTTMSQAGSGGNCEGCWEADIYISVTSAPSGGAATAEIWTEESPDNSNFSAAAQALSVSIPNGSTGYFYAGVLSLPAYCKAKIKAISYGFTASLIAHPYLPEAQ